jgi:hypothetical protein
MKKLPARPILLVAVAIVLGMGLLFILKPETVLAVIFGIAPSDAMQGAGRIGGAATLALGIAGWPGYPGQRVRKSSIQSIMVFFGLVAVLLAYQAYASEVAGPALWPTVVVLGAMAVALAMSGNPPAFPNQPQGAPPPVPR